MSDNLARFPTPQEAFRQMRRPAHISPAFDNPGNIPPPPHQERFHHAPPSAGPKEFYSQPATPDTSAPKQQPYRSFSGPGPDVHSAAGGGGGGGSSSGGGSSGGSRQFSGGQHPSSGAGSGGAGGTGSSNSLPRFPPQAAPQSIPYTNAPGRAPPQQHPQSWSQQPQQPQQPQQSQHSQQLQQLQQLQLTQQPQQPQQRSQHPQHPQQPPQPPQAQNAYGMQPPPQPRLGQSHEARPRSHPGSRELAHMEQARGRGDKADAAHRVPRRPVRGAADSSGAAAPGGEGLRSTSSSSLPTMSTTKPKESADLRSLFDDVDRHKCGYLTERELSKALVNGDYTLFDAHTVRLMMKMFDRDGDGAIYFAEFGQLWKYLHDWRQVFDRFDITRSESIDYDEFCRALAAFGYTLTTQCVRFLFNAGSKLNRNGQREMSFDMFVQSCISIKSITDTFKRYDTDRDGYVTMGFEEFLIETTKLH